MVWLYITWALDLRLDSMMHSGLIFLVEGIFNLSLCWAI